MHRDRPDAGDGHIDLGLGAADQATRELGAHGGRQRHAAAIAAE